MSEFQETPRVVISRTRRCLVATIQIDLNEAVLRQFQDDLLNQIKTTASTGIVLDLSGVRILDSESFRMVRETIEMASLMGARSILTGLRPGVVAALMDRDEQVDDLEAASDVDEAVERLAPSPPAQPESPIEDEGEGEEDDDEPAA